MDRFLLTFVVVAIISTSTHVDGKAVDDVELRAECDPACPDGKICKTGECVQLQAYYVDDGCHDAKQEKRKTDDFKGFYQPENLKAGVRCCSTDGETIIHEGKKRFCTTLGSCNGRNGVTLEEAVEQCADKDYRLCTKEEMMSDQCCGTGGNCDSHLVWTSTPAKYYVDDGCHDEKQEKRKTDDYAGFYQDANLKAGVRCCSIDGKTIIHQGKERFCTTLGSCNRNNGVTFFEAREQCTLEGYRLCTKAELMKDECCGTGGNCDSHLVWTSTTGECTSSTECAAGQGCSSTGICGSCTASSECADGQECSSAGVCE